MTADRAPDADADADRAPLQCRDEMCGLSVMVAAAPVLCAAQSDGTTEREATVANARLLVSQLRGDCTQECPARTLLGLAIRYDHLGITAHSTGHHPGHGTGHDTDPDTEHDTDDPTGT